MGDAWSAAELDNDVLVEAYVENVQIYGRIDHIGAANRQMDRRRAIVEELSRRSGGSLDQLRPLLKHPDPNVCHIAALEFRRIDRAAFEITIKGLAERSDKIGAEARDSLQLDARFQEEGYPEDRRSDWVAPPPSQEMTWQCDNEPPLGLPANELQQLLIDQLATEAAEALFRLARPAIGLWPQRPNPHGPQNVSRLGGEPSVPDNWSWPMVETEPEDEPMLFLGQINCTELEGLPGADRLPSSGMLSFFGDHDAVMGCDYGDGDFAVFYWQNTEALRPQRSPKKPMETILPCNVAFRPTMDLPHPESHAVAGLQRDQTVAANYPSIYQRAREHGIPEQYWHYCSFGKLLGWPALVQQELYEIQDCIDPRGLQLLLQLDDYHNGTDGTWWGPGGSLYFLMTDANLRARRFADCVFEVQVT